MASSPAPLRTSLPPQTPVSSERELVVIVRQKVGLRVSLTGLTATHSPFLKSFQNVLMNANAQADRHRAFIDEAEVIRTGLVAQ